MAKRYWLLKSEPSVFSLQDLARSPGRTTSWEGVRSYQARNRMKAMRKDDEAIFYHSNADPPAAVGTVTIVREAYPDDAQFDPRSPYHDAKSDPEDPRWLMVDVRYGRAFRRPVPLSELRGRRSLAQMELLRRGSRLSIQPVRSGEWRTILKMGGLT